MKSVNCGGDFTALTLLFWTMCFSACATKLSHYILTVWAQKKIGPFCVYMTKLDNQPVTVGKIERWREQNLISSAQPPSWISGFLQILWKSSKLTQK